MPPTRTIDDLETELGDAILGIGPMVVAFSGGVDSTLVLAAARRFLPQEKVLAATADSASLATGELEHCRSLADRFDVEWAAPTTHEMSDARYRANDADRCFWCKTALMDQLEPVAAERNAAVVLGVNLDDLGDHRPGQEAARQRGARFPLVDAAFTKADVRRLARAWDLPVWDRPAMPCLSSRIPYGTEVTVPLLSRIDRAEHALRTLGFDDVRVRHYGQTARIEIPADEMMRAVQLADVIVGSVTAAGYRDVTLDLAGLRSGNLNRDLARS